MKPYVGKHTNTAPISNPTPIGNNPQHPEITHTIAKQFQFVFDHLFVKPVRRSP